MPAILTENVFSDQMETLDIQFFLRDLPDPERASRFFEDLSNRAPVEAKKLVRDSGLLSDVLTLASYSPLLASTLLQNTEYINWLNRQRKEPKTRNRDELLESLARFSFTHTGLPPQVMLARFRRRELLRIYLRDIRRLGTIAEITEEISNLADTILEYALRHAAQEMDNRYGQALERDDRGREMPASFCVISLGKLGSKELNYSSDIDLLFLYSSDGATSGQGTRGSVTNKEYFIKLSELVAKVVGEQTGEGAAYRVDLRLRPHGRVGAIAISLNEATAYYNSEARPWERQVLIRARCSAGDTSLFKIFYSRVLDSIYPKNATVAEALRNVRLSKEKIDTELGSTNGFNVKLGRGGIREIEFIAQALQLALGGNDPWLREPHTLISLSKLRDRKLISEAELTSLSDAYDFLRRIEHHLQMEHGVQTHVVPEDSTRRKQISGYMGFDGVELFDTALSNNTAAVSHAFIRSLGEDAIADVELSFAPGTKSPEFTAGVEDKISHSYRKIIASVEKHDSVTVVGDEKDSLLSEIANRSPYLSEVLSASPWLIDSLPKQKARFTVRDYKAEMVSSVTSAADAREALSNIRKQWARFMIEIACHDLFGSISMFESKALQTQLAEASIAAAKRFVAREMQATFGNDGPGLGILALGKLGGGGMDHGSDIDMIATYDDESLSDTRRLVLPEYYSKAVELFVSALSSFTKDGYLYRIDLRLRPDGKNGPLATGKRAFYEYIEKRAAIWEYLAFIKLRGIDTLAAEVESTARRLIHQRALEISDVELKSETRRVRDQLEKQKVKNSKGFDLKYSSGGLLDVYFSMRYLQLRDNVPEDVNERSTTHMLSLLHQKGSISADVHSALSDGYVLLSRVDHALRLIAGRTTREPLSNPQIFTLVSERLGNEAPSELAQQLTLARMNIRSAFESIVG